MTGINLSSLSGHFMGFYYLSGAQMWEKLKQGLTARSSLSGHFMGFYYLSGVQMWEKLKQGLTARWKTKKKLGSRNPNVEQSHHWLLLVVTRSNLRWSDYPIVELLNWRKLCFPYPFSAFSIRWRELLQVVPAKDSKGAKIIPWGKCFSFPHFPLIQTLTRWRNPEKSQGWINPTFHFRYLFYVHWRKIGGGVCILWLEIG